MGSTFPSPPKAKKKLRDNDAITALVNMLHGWEHTVDPTVFAKSSIVVMIWHQYIDTKIAD